MSDAFDIAIVMRQRVQELFPRSVVRASMLCDCNDLWEAVHSLVPRMAEKRLRVMVDATQEGLRLGEIDAFDWIPKEVMAADAMTKRAAEAGQR